MRYYASLHLKELQNSLWSSIEVFHKMKNVAEKTMNVGEEEQLQFLQTSNFNLQQYRPMTFLLRSPGFEPGTFRTGQNF